MKKKCRDLLMFGFCVIFLVSAWQVVKIRLDYKEGSNSYSSLEQYVFFENILSSESQPERVDTEKEKCYETTTLTKTIEIICDEILWPHVDFATLGGINPDIIGWIYIEGTEVNYPVVQGSDNDFYLRHLFDGTYNSSGCLFLDAYSATDFTEMNSVIYGHHMKNGTMFYDLKEYKNQEFYENHPYALLVTPDHKYKILFFSAYVSRTSASAWDVGFSDVGYEEWLFELTGKSCFKANVVPTQDDRVVTLSTCSYEFNNARFVVHGILQECE